MGQVQVAIGTRKGLFLARSRDGRATWEIDGPHFTMEEVYSVGIDVRAERPRILVGATSEHWGPSVFRSDDLGTSWRETERGSIRHPHRPTWQPGGGGLCLHTVLPHPTDPEAVAVGISTGGVYRTSDGGKTWEPSNTGIAAHYLPDPHPEYGQCVHKMGRNPGRPDQVFLQNHGGVYRSDDGGNTWTSIGAGLPSDFGFPIVVHPHRPGWAYVFPLTADAQRMPPDLRCQVYRTEDAGETWRELSTGLPRQDHYGTVLRDAMTADPDDPAGIYFGNRNGEVYASRDEGESWQLLAAHLPDVLCVRAAVVG